MLAGWGLWEDCSDSASPEGAVRVPSVGSGALHTLWLPSPLMACCALRRRHTPYGNQTDYRIFELNKRLQNWTEVGSWESEGWLGQYFGSGGPHRLLPHVAVGQGLSPPSLSTQLEAQSSMAAVPGSQYLSLLLLT